MSKVALDVTTDPRRRADSKPPGESAVRAAFLRSCSSHYISVLLPELRRFEQHLKKQDLLVAISPIQPLDKNVLQAGLMIEYPIDTTNLLEIRYDFTRREMTISQLFGGRRYPEPDHRFPIASIDKISSLQLYDIVERYVTSVLELQVE